MALPKPANNKSQKLATVLSVARVAVHWGFIPTLLYLGFKRGAEPGEFYY